ncbi:cell division protein FtsA [Candidatus Azambacteria bacterium RIFCSPHIGHO2_01_FULL_40_24]|uniref:Cell division protein FtsA n=1 Tax=Candidatus Azambacteria bacterium RIFCSPHIGHO2_01_FULL_40_24 TaxID=1797301 RepID=A0A1F5B376_9BACT|nr:MAG: cell division protein FtsA [Candidatus Azambacteria bacterium RIFCSPHIGHO2_01_FULL_40_24]
MSRDDIIIGLDIGTTSVQVVVAFKKKNQEAPQIIGWAEVPSRGVRRGAVVDIEEAAATIREAWQKAISHAGIKHNEAVVGVGGSNIFVRPSKGVVIVSRADREISREDIQRALVQAEAIPASPNREILHNLAREWIVDGERGVKDPLGMSGVKLEVDTLIIECGAPALKNLRKAIALSGVKIKELVLSPLAASYAVLSPRQKELGTLVLDIGGSTTGMVVFEEGDIFHTAILGLGSAHTTHDLVYGLQVDVDTAEKIKKLHGSALAESTSSRDMVDLKKLGGDNSIQRREIAVICEARFSEIFEAVQKELKKVGRASMLPGGAILTGGGSKIPRLDKLAKKELSLPVSRGAAQKILGPEEIIQDPIFATALGLVIWGFDETYNRVIMDDSVPSGILGWLKNFIP